MSVPEISVKELKTLIDEEKDIFILDVRERLELVYGTVPGFKWIPMEDVLDRKDEVPKDKKVVVYCRSGQRSEMVATKLIQDGYDAVNLTGGILAWKEIDPNVVPY